MHEGAPLYVELPASVELIIPYTEPGVQGDRSTGGTKPATLETGAEIQVPLFITTGEKIKVDTRDGRLPRPRQQLAAGVRPEQDPQARPRHPVRGRPARSDPVTTSRTGGTRPTPSRRSPSTPSSWSKASRSTGTASTS